MVLRSIEDHLRTQGAADLTVAVSTEGALYILNHKRAYLRDIEMRYGVSIVIQMDENAHGGTFTLTRGSSANAPVVAESKAIHMEPPSQAAASDGDDDEEEETAATAAEAGDDKRPLRRKRRRRRGGRGEASNEPVAFQNGAMPAADGAFADDGGADEDEAEADEASADAGAVERADQPGSAEEGGPRTGGNGEDFRRNRRRGRRGGRRHRDEMGGSVELGKPEAGGIPGLGEQPGLGFDLHFPKSTVLGPVSQEQAAQERSSAPEPAVAEAPVPVEAAPQPEPGGRTCKPGTGGAGTVKRTRAGGAEAPVPVEAAPQPEPQAEPVASPIMAMSEFGARARIRAGSRAGRSARARACGSGAETQAREGWPPPQRLVAAAGGITIARAHSRKIEAGANTPAFFIVAMSQLQHLGPLRMPARCRDPG